MATTSKSGPASLIKALPGSTYRLPAYVYPRYAYFQHRISLFETYLKKMQEKSKFEDTISQGGEKLTALYETLKLIQPFVKVSLYCEDITLLNSIENTFLVKLLKDDDKWKKESVSLEGSLKRSTPMDLLEVMVLVFEEVDVKLLQDLSSLCQGMAEGQKSMCLLYYTKLSRSFSLEELESAKFDPAILGQGETKMTLAQHVQYSLEAHVVDTLECMSDIMNEVLPHPGERQTQNLASFVCNDFFIWYENEHVLEDLSPIPKSPGSDYTAPSSTMKTDELDALFRKKMLEYLARKTRCRCCEYIGKAHGLKEAVTNHYLQEVFSFEGKFIKALSKLTVPTYDDLRMSRMYTFRSFSSMATTDVRHLIGGLEKMLSSLLAILEKMRRLQYLVHGLLRLTNVKMVNKVPDIPKLPLQLQLDLLGLPFVTGCGTIFGRLTIHVGSQLSILQEKEVEELVVQTHRYNFPYKTEVSTPKMNKQAGGDKTKKEIEQGCCVEAERHVVDENGNPYAYSSLGCFVEVFTNETEKRLHFVTCFHCVENCQQTVAAKFSPVKRIPFGNISSYLHRQSDVALVEVLKDKYGNVSKQMRGCGIADFGKWSFWNQENSLQGRSVYKVGAETGLRFGLISSDDYLYRRRLPDNWKTESVLIYPKSAVDVSEDSSVVLDETMDTDEGPAAAGIGSTEGAVAPGISEVDKIFSEEGDSGAAVCDTDPDTADGVVIALLQGGLDDHQDQYFYSYGCIMESALEKLKQHFNIYKIEPALEAELR